MYVAEGQGQLGDVGGIFDTIKAIVGTAAKVFKSGATATVHPPGMPPVSIDLTDPNALRKARTIARSITIAPGQPPSVLEQVGDAAGSFITSPAGLVVLGGLALLLLRRK